MSRSRRMRYSSARISTSYPASGEKRTRSCSLTLRYRRADRDHLGPHQPAVLGRGRRDEGSHLGSCGRPPPPTGPRAGGQRSCGSTASSRRARRLTTTTCDRAWGGGYCPHITRFFAARPASWPPMAHG
jgi:hypothetical protein